MPVVIGQDPDFVVNCRNCGAKLSYTREEIHAGDPIDHDDHAGFIVCPKCSRRVRVKQTVSREVVEQRRRDELRDI